MCGFYRVAGEVALSIKTGNTLSLNNPVNKNRLKEMYEDLRCDWPRIKKNLKSNNKHPDSVKEMILIQLTQNSTLDFILAHLTQTNVTVSPITVPACLNFFP